MSSNQVGRAKTVAEAIEIYERDGIVVMEGVLMGAALEKARRAVKHAIDHDRETETKQRGFVFDRDDKNIRIFNLCGKDRAFRELVEHPIAVEMVTRSLGPGFMLSNFSGNVTGPGSAAMGMHADGGYMPEPWGREPVAMNVAWILDDFTEEVGATRIVPGSYHYQRNPGVSDAEAGTGVAKNSVPVEAPAGSIFVMDGKVWHQTGRNVSKDKTRTGLFAYYIKPFIKPQYDWTRAIDEADLADASPLLRYMLGFSAFAPMSGEVLPYPAKPERAHITV
jgi:ectoine hydroxylase-related dioxygenase (phytanoyl-CoA dioxygenase family)